MFEFGALLKNVQVKPQKQGKQMWLYQAMVEKFSFLQYTRKTRFW